MVVMYYAAISVRGKSITILQSVEEMRRSWGCLCYSGHTTPRAMLSPGVDPSVCLSYRCPLSHDMSARSDPVRGEDGEMATWSYFPVHSMPCTFKLDLLFLFRGALLQCGELHRTCHHWVPQGHVWSAAGRQWRPLGGSDCWVSSVSRSVFSFPWYLPRAEKLVGGDSWYIWEWSTSGKVMVCHQDLKGRKQKYIPRTKVLGIKCWEWNNCFSSEICAVYTINYLMDQRVPSYSCSMIDHCAAEICPRTVQGKRTKDGSANAQERQEKG